MKNFNTFTFIFFIGLSSAFGQCEVPNGSFENWSEVDVAFSDDDPDLMFTVLSPDEFIPAFRFLIYVFGIAFGEQDAALEYQADPQTAYGVQQSEDSFDGNYAARLKATPFLNFNDLFTAYDCADIPDSISFQVKHIGESLDTIVLGAYFTEGLPQTPSSEEEIANTPAYIQSAFFYSEDTEYQKITLPVINNFEAETDSVAIEIFSVTSQESLDNGIESYFLIDDIQMIYEEPSSIDNVNNLSFEVSPNPADDIVNIAFEESSKVDLYCYTSNGRLIQTKKNVSPQWDVSGLLPGLYNIKLVDKQSGKQGFHRLLIQR